MHSQDAAPICTCLRESGSGEDAQLLRDNQWNWDSNCKLEQPGPLRKIGAPRLLMSIDVFVAFRNRVLVALIRAWGIPVEVAPRAARVFSITNDGSPGTGRVLEAMAVAVGMEQGSVLGTGFYTILALHIETI